MNIFVESEAEYFCSAFNRSAGDAEGSLRDYCNNKFARRATVSVQEGTARFTELRDCLLRSVERRLFLASANYRAAHPLIVGGLSSWAHVTLYYSAFHAALALLGMFGAWVDWPGVIHVKVGNIGRQELEYDRNPRGLTTYGGSHRAFWDLFYESVASLNAYVDTSLKVAITPVHSNPIWLIETRNEINYDSFKACSFIEEFISNYRAKDFPDSLPGVLNTQFTITEALNTLAFQYARQFKLRADAFDKFRPRNRTLGQRIDKYVFKTRSGAKINRSLKRVMVGV